MIGIDPAVNNIAIWCTETSTGFIVENSKGEHKHRCLDNVSEIVSWMMSSKGAKIGIEFTSARTRASVPVIAYMGFTVGLLTAYLGMNNEIELVHPQTWMGYWKKQNVSIKKDIQEFLDSYPKADEKKKIVHGSFLSSLSKKERSAILRVAKEHKRSLMNNLVDAAGIAYWMKRLE